MAWAYKDSVRMLAGDALLYEFFRPCRMWLTVWSKNGSITRILVRFSLFFTG